MCCGRVHELCVITDRSILTVQRTILVLATYTRGASMVFSSSAPVQDLPAAQ
jgi:hypothetical protein